MGYKGIDAPNIIKKVKFVKASDSSQQKVSTGGKSEIPSPEVKVQKRKVYQTPKSGQTDRVSLRFNQVHLIFLTKVKR